MAEPDLKSNPICVDSGILPNNTQQKQNRQPISLPTCLLVAVVIISIVASACILLISNNRTMVAGSMHIGPAVLLAIFSSAFNTSLGFLLSAGLAITWWRAVQHGTSLTRLQHIWDAGLPRSFRLSSILGTLLNRTVLVTSVVAIAKFANNPLLQRSISLVSQDEIINILANLTIAQDIPDWWFGVANYSDWNTGGTLNVNFLSALQSWKQNKTMSTKDHGGFWCDGTCDGLVPGIGFAVLCDPPTLSTMDMLSTANQGAIGFSVQYQNEVDKQANISMFHVTSRFISNITDPCIATITSQRCSVQLATVLHPIRIQNSSITISNHKPRKIVATSNTSAADLLDHGYGPAGPLWGLMTFGTSELSANGTITVGSGSFIVHDNTDILGRFEVLDPEMYSEYSRDNCALQWTDPMPYILESMDEFFFRVALAAGRGSSVSGISNTSVAAVTPQTFQMQDRKITLKYHTSKVFAILALVVMFTGLVAALGLLYGFWELQREVTLSPLEVAWAFRSPIFTATTGENLGITQILKAVEKTRVVSEKGLIFAVVDPEELPGHAEEQSEFIPTHSEHGGSPAPSFKSITKRGQPVVDVQESSK
jgi:hypothetical protein